MARTGKNQSCTLLNKKKAHCFFLVMSSSGVSSCALLARRYVAEGGPAIPVAEAPTAVRSDWLLTQTWGCIPPGRTLADFSADPKVCQATNDPPPPPTTTTTTTSTALTRPPMFNYLQEAGFLHWVNQRGLQCVNRIVGNFYGLNLATGNANTPGVSVSPPDSQCWGACFQVTSASDTCFECVNQTLTAHPDLCPQLDPTHPDDENLIRDAVNCHECIGTQGTLAPATSVNETALVNHMWQCVVGEVRAPLSTADLVTVVLIAVFVAVLATVLGVYYGYFHPRIVRKEQQRRQLLAAGFAPDEL